MKKPRLTWAIAPGILAGLAAIVFVVWDSDNRAQALTDILAIVLSWPVSAGVIALFVSLRFRDPIERFIDRLKRVEGPAGFAAIAEQQAAGEAEDTPDPALLDELREKSEQLDEVTAEFDANAAALEQASREIEQPTELGATLAKALVERDDALRRISELRDLEARQAKAWQLAYLGVYLTPATQAILKWLRDFPGGEPFANLIRLSWAALPTSTAVDASLSALEQQGLVERKSGPLAGVFGDVYHVTATGTEFLASPYVHNLIDVIVKPAYPEQRPPGSPGFTGLTIPPSG